MCLCVGEVAAFNPSFQSVFTEGQRNTVVSAPDLYKVEAGQA